MGKQEYPKMIYKGEGNKGNLKVERRIVKSRAEHMQWLEIWGDKRPANLVPEKGPESVVKAPEVPENGPESSVAADSAPVEVKPKRRGRPKKQG